METREEPSDQPASGWWLIPAGFFMFLGFNALGLRTLFSAAGGILGVFCTTCWFVGAIRHMRTRSERAGRVVSADDEEGYDRTLTAIAGVVFVLLLLAPWAIPVAFWVANVWYVMNILFIR